MKALLVSPRFPWPPHTGDRLRTTIWLAALARTGDVALVAPDGVVPKEAPALRFFAARRSLTRGVQGVVSLVRHALPLQCLLAAPYDWSAAIGRATQEAGPFDVTVVLLSRLHPWVRASLHGRTVLDAVDSLRRNAEERRRAAAGPMRRLWAREERRLAQLEGEAGRTYGRVVVVSEEECADFGDAVAVTNGITTAPLSDRPRTFDFGFWGRLPYFANADAAQWLLREIWPAIRAERPAATLVIGGAGASPSLRNAAARSGVTLVSPIDDVSSFARSIRVALMPLRYGSGQSNKILEAGEAGCALVGTPQALRGLTPLQGHSRIESTAAGFARAALELLADEDLRAALGATLRGIVASTYDRSVTLDRLAAIAAGSAA